MSSESSFRDKRTGCAGGGGCDVVPEGCRGFVGGGFGVGSECEKGGGAS